MKADCSARSIRRLEWGGDIYPPTLGFMKETWVFGAISDQFRAIGVYQESSRILSLSQAPPLLKGPPEASFQPVSFGRIMGDDR